MPNLSKKTITKMRAVIAAVLAEPQFYDQMKFPTHCNSVCCSAGWAVWLNDPTEYKRLAGTIAPLGWPGIADRVLGIEDSDEKLFYSPGFWPSKFAEMYYGATIPLGRAQAMAARWEHFIATDGAE